MFPTVHGVRLDIEAISGIMGSVSIACWLVVFSPQIIENFRRGSAEGLSISFLLIWLVGDLFNISGGIFQGVLPTMLILAVYYTLADIVLLAQVLYYNGYSFKSKSSKSTATMESSGDNTAPTEESALIPRIESSASDRGSHSLHPAHANEHSIGNLALRRSSSGTSFSSLLHTNIDGVHLSPATPMIEAPTMQHGARSQSALHTAMFNLGAILLVCLAGVGGWYLAELRSQRSAYEHTPRKDDTVEDDLEFDALGQVFGYFCAALYLGSRIPQLLLNYRRKSTEGVSMLFFLFACVGNLTYVLSIFAFEPACAKLGGRRGDDWDGRATMGHHGRGRKHPGCADGQWNETYVRYIWINLSWIVGSAGTLLLDLAVFAQFWIYQGNSPVDASTL